MDSFVSWKSRPETTCTGNNDTISKFVKQFNSSKYDLTSPSPGLYSSNIDGYEEFINDNNINIYDTTIDTIEKTIEENRKNKEEYIAIEEYYSLLEDLRTLYDKDGI